MKISSLFKTRSQFLIVLLTAVMALIVLRLFDMQILRHSYFVDLASREQVKKLTIPASRGQIYALDGDKPVPLVMNQQVYTVFADPTVVEEPDAVEAAVRSVAGGELVKGDIGARLRDDSSQYQVLAKEVTLRQAEMIKAKKLKGVGFQKVSKRVYPEGQLASQTLGFVNSEGEGQYGVEAALQARMTGVDGMLRSVTDVANVPLSIGKNNIRKEPKNGDSIVLTIDRNVQAKAEDILASHLQKIGATHGSLAVMDPASGHMVAMANMPTYSPAEFTKVQDASAFVNGVTMTPYEPGSVLKTYTVATGIDKGVIAANSTFYNTDKIRVEDRTITNALKGKTGTISMQTALDNSLNTGMVTIAQRLGDGENITKVARDTMYEYFHNRLGLGQKTGIEIAGEVAGTFIPPDAPGGQGNAVRFSNVAFGQGLDVTMVQVMAGFSAIINGGIYHAPTVVAGTYQDGRVTPEPPKATRSGVISEDASRQTREMVHKARTGYTSADSPGYYIGGKTGTSQTLENGKYVSNQTVGTYLGFGGTKNQSKYVIMVQVSGKGMNLEGNRHAMPIFTELSNWLLTYYQLQPEK
jgi:cell division protein FtsI/penicillin-binding protein 2